METGVGRSRPILLLIGNGPNRLEHQLGSPSWDELMKDLAKSTGYKAFNTGSKPLPLAFEEVLGRAASLSGVGEDHLKARVAEVARRVKGNWFHSTIRELPVSDILTTNYDYALTETDSPSDIVPGSTETKYSLFRRQKFSGTTVWHIHGEATAPDTLLLGHDHYVRYSGRVQQYLRPTTGGVSEPEAWRVSDAVSPLAAGMSDFEALEPTPKGYPRYSWVDLFLTRELHIMGLGMDFSEIILWWLLTIRARREEQEKHGLGVELQRQGSVTWWECGPDKIEASYSDRREVAEALGVRTRFYETPGRDYASAYRRMLGDLKAQCFV